MLATIILASSIIVTNPATLEDNVFMSYDQLWSGKSSEYKSDVKDCYRELERLYPNDVTHIAKNTIQVAGCYRVVKLSEKEVQLINIAEPDDNFNELPQNVLIDNDY